MNEMNERHALEELDRDPLGLRGLEMQAASEDGWPAIASALQTAARPTNQHWAKAVGWLAAAACLMLVAGLSTRFDDWRVAAPTEEGGTMAEAQTVQPVAGTESLPSLIAMSQSLEAQLRGLRDGNGAMPAESALYIAELEDLVAQVDQQLSFSPRSLDLWGHRVNLLLDLAQIYQQQWEREYGRMASL